MKLKLQNFMDIDQFFARFDLPGGSAADLNEVWLYERRFTEAGYTLSIRPVCLKTDISLMHRWATHPQAWRFWQMRCGKQELYDDYVKLLQDKLVFTFLLYMDNIPVAQTDIYQALKDEISEHFAASPHDYGIHLLMAPYKEVMSKTPLPLKRLSLHTLLTIIGFLFSFDTVERIMAEPDKQNKAANLLALKAGFKWRKEIKLSCKTANLYSYEKEDFFNNHPL